MLATSSVLLGAALLLAAPATLASVTNKPSSWTNVKIGGGGGFFPSFVFNPSEQGLVYARTDMGGTYRLNSDDSWTMLTDFANVSTWDLWGNDALASDPVDTNNLYIAAGMYTNSWDPNNGTIMKSTDKGETFQFIPLPFKVGGNMPGNGMGERLAVDPNNNNILYFGARSGHGLWKSTDAGLTWSNVTNFPSVGTFMENPSDTSGYGNDPMGIAWVTFDSTSKTSAGSSRVFVGVANMASNNVFMTEDNGKTWAAVAGQNNSFIPHHGVLSPKEGPALYITYCNDIGSSSGTAGYVMKYFINNGSWVNITPAQGIADNSYGYGGLAVDLQRPGTVQIASLNDWYPDAQIYRSTNGGSSWTPLYTYGYPGPDYTLAVDNYFNWDVSKAPWIATFTGTDTKLAGWMIEGMSIDPFDSNHWLYGTGLTVYGGHDLLNWDASPRKNITIASLADGMEHMAVLGLTAPLEGPLLLSAVGDDGFFVHTDLTVPPEEATNPTWSGNTADSDYAGAAPQHIVRLGTQSGQPLATSSDTGATWSPYAPGESTAGTGGHIAITADGSNIIWSGATGLNGIMTSSKGGQFVAVQGLPSDAMVASDKLNASLVYAAAGSAVYRSTDGGLTFKQTSGVGNSNTVNAIKASPFKSGEVFISTNVGIFHSSNAALSVTGMSDVTSSWAIAVGVPSSSPSTSNAVLFAIATIQNVIGLYRTEDLGANWVRIDDDGVHGFGDITGNPLAADARVYGRVFIGTNGRGVFVGTV